MIASDATGKPASVSLRYKILAYAAAWIAALIVTDPSFGLLPLAYMFPLGLARVVLPAGTNASGWTVLGFFWVIYAGHAVLFFRSKNVRATIIWLALLIVLFAGNIAGCRDMIHAH